MTVSSICSTVLSACVLHSKMLTVTQIDERKMPCFNGLQEISGIFPEVCLLTYEERIRRLSESDALTTADTFPRTSCGAHSLAVTSPETFLLYCHTGSLPDISTRGGWQGTFWKSLRSNICVLPISRGKCPDFGFKS